MGLHHHAGHGHGHDHSHHQSATSNKAFAIAIAITLSYALIEVGYGLVAHSMSLLADAVHNLGDVLGLVLAGIANWLLTIPARKRYSYGFKKTTIIAALINAFILVATSVLIAYESIHKLLHLQAVDESIVLWVGFIGILVNGGCSLLFMRGAHNDLNIKGAFWHLLADALILGGVVISALIIRYTHYYWLDPVLGLIIVGIVLWGASSLLRDSLHMILDAIPRYIDHQGVENFLLNYPGVTDVHDLHIWGLSTREIALTAHLIMPHSQLQDTDHRKISTTLLEQFHINHVTIQVEKGNAETPCLRMDTC